MRVEIEVLFDGIDFAETLTRAKFEEFNMDLFKKMLAPSRMPSPTPNSRRPTLMRIIIVGDTIRITKVQELLKEMFDGKELTKGINPNEVVVYDITVQGSNISDEGERSLTKD